MEFVRPLAFRYANESFRLKMIEPVNHLMPWNTFRVEGSEWIDWFHDQTFGIYREWRVQHFMFLGEDVFEVLSRVEPSVTQIQR